MRIRPFTLLLVTLLAAGCALFPESGSEEPSRPQDAESFARVVREGIQEHEWQTLLSASDPALYQTSVVRDRVPEPLYLARLLGLDQVGNLIQEGDTLEWEDLDRIALVTLAPVRTEEPPYRFTGLATLESGERLRLDAWVTQVRGRYVLTDPPTAGQ